MNYLTEARQNALAAEYVLGTLQGSARARFERLLMQHPEIRKAVWHWEAHLNQLGSSMPNLDPPARVWEAIQRRLGHADVEPRRVNQANLPQRKLPLWSWTGGLSAAAVLLVAVLLVTLQSPRLIAPGHVAVVQDKSAQALWLIELTDKSIRVTATDKFKPLPDRDYELWIVAADGRPPVSLGLLPKSGKLTLARSALFDQVSVAALAVSQEPLGGSPTGQPTEVLYSAQLVTL